MLGSLILYLKGMRRMMFQLSGFYCNSSTLNPKPLLDRFASCKVWLMSSKAPFDDCASIAGFLLRKLASATIIEIRAPLRDL